ncbi:MAG: phosphate/phosphite/phosphonate ABC transporter substrate-binding protein [Rhizobiaceae bacterium]
MSAPIATLSMYDWPETQITLDGFWEQISNNLKKSGIEAPSNLTRDEEVTPLWTDKNLLVGQTCGWPYANRLRGKVVPFARFDYGLKDCPPGYYNSVYIGRSPEDRKYLQNRYSLLSVGKIAINGDDSQSGFHVFREITGEDSPLAISAEKREITGSHRNSVKSVAEGNAQIAAIDAVAFELSKRYDPELASRVVVIGNSVPKPGLPLITSLTNNARTKTIYEAIDSAITTLSDAERDTLLIAGLAPASDPDYEEFL